eukprot:2977675-Pleurochrysis_carterae.AAC.1
MVNAEFHARVIWNGASSHQSRLQKALCTGASCLCQGAFGKLVLPGVAASGSVDAGGRGAARGAIKATRRRKK